MAGNYCSWGLCRKCGAEVTIHRKYGGQDNGKLGYNCGRCWMRDVAKPVLEYARRAATKIHQFKVFRRRKRA